MESLSRKQLTGFIKSLKGGASVAEALAANYDGMTLAQLETGWRREIRRNDPLAGR